MRFSEIVKSFADCCVGSYVYSDANVVAYRFLTEEEDAYDPGYLYVGIASQLNLRPYFPANANIILICDEAANTSMLSLNLNNYVLIDSKVDNLSLFQRIRKLFGSEKFLVKSSRILMKASEQKIDIPALIDIASGLLGNPIMLVDISFCLLCRSRQDKVEEPFWKETIETGRVPEYYLNYILQNKADETNEIAIEDAPEICKYKVAFGKIIVDGLPIGYIKMLELNRQFTTADLELLSLLCRIVSIEMRRGAMAGDFYNHKSLIFMERLLSGQLTDPSSISDRMEWLDIHLKNNLYILCLNAIPGNHFPEKILYVNRMLQEELMTQLSVFHSQHLTFLLSTDRDETDFTNTVAHKLKPFLKKYNLRAAISPAFENVLDSARYEKSAVNSLDIMSKLNYGTVFSRYEDLAIYHMVYRNIENTSDFIYRHPVIMSLCRDGSKRNDSLLNSLEVYLECNKDLSMASKQLFVHYNTLKYRIGRIAEQTHFDFDDPNAVLSLRLCFKGLRLMYPDCVRKDGSFNEMKLREEILSDSRAPHLEK